MLLNYSLFSENSQEFYDKEALTGTTEQVRLQKNMILSRGFWLHINKLLEKSYIFKRKKNRVPHLKKGYSAVPEHYHPNFFLMSAQKIQYRSRFPRKKHGIYHSQLQKFSMEVCLQRNILFSINKISHG